MKQAMYMFILLSGLIYMTGCAINTTQSNLQDKPYTPPSPHTFTYNNQEFQIIPMYGELMSYVQYVEKGNSHDASTYREFVLEPFRTEAFGENDGYDIYTSNYREYFDVPIDIYQLKRDILILSEYQDIINSAISEALKQSRDLLPGGDKKFYIIPFISNGYASSSAGITLNEEVVVLQIGSSFLDEELKNVTAHEYHHTIFLEHQDKTNRSLPTLIGNILLEGKAVAFAKMIYPDVLPKLENILYDDEKFVWEEIKKDMNSADKSLYEKFIYGDANIPRLSNYKVGYQIMKSYIEHNPDVDILEWTLMPAEDILAESKYTDKFID
ncbi:hypothetical protein EJF36_03635 [Bacillus sp. HMF5848]|uniref:DUF2268 domain-containing protein n=1 Tax=Bacillus sp. HMF5848 TaxID=2495421 RepID=UPI000F78191D|nr:DUF2268 domain-containing putative Zn-dependent protease [Bacillus sp. HMF5848]RSK26037.1 hypothetical protein EJF36_03635 [Bacillus sp. HMF5848]